MTHRDFINSFLAYSDKTVEDKLTEYFGLKREGNTFQCLKWSRFFEEEPVGLVSGTPAQIVEHILNKRWKLDAHDKDMIVMWHRFVCTIHGVEEETQTSLIVVGEDNRHTAMAKTVGLPLGIAAMLLLENKIPQRGVIIPTTKEFFEPILNELKSFGIQFTETKKTHNQS